jgi:hypothetical protein
MKEHLLGVMIGLALFGGEGADVGAHHALGTEAQIAWKARLQGIDDALARNDVAGAEGFWREAYAAALKSRHWEGMVAVGDAYRRIGARAGFRAIAHAKARETYLAALFRARSQGSVDGVLRAAQGFTDLGDHAVVEQCLGVARSVAAQSKDPHAGERVRMFAERWAARAREADHLGSRRESEGSHDITGAENLRGDGAGTAWQS